MSSIPLAKTDWSAGDKFTAVEANKLGVNSNLLLKSLVAGENLTVTVPKPIYIGDGASFSGVMTNTDTGGGFFRLDTAGMKAGETFVIPSTYLSGQLTKVRFRLLKSGSPTTNVVCNIYATDASHNPTGESLGSASIPCASLTGSGVDYDFNITANLTPGVEYFAQLTVDGTINDSNYVGMYFSNNDTVPNSNGRYFQSSWLAYPTEFTFRIEYNYTQTTAGKFYNAKANDTSKILVVGWLLESATKDSSYIIQLGGIISGFSGLTINSKYYLKDDGTIGTTAGTNSVMVGIAISATELFFTRA